MTEENTKFGKPKSHFKEDKTHIWGKFHELQVPGKAVPRHRLCKIEEAEYKLVGKRMRKRKRSGEEYDSYLEALYAKKLQELTREYDKQKLLREGKTEADRHYFQEAVDKYKEEYLPGLKPSTLPGWTRIVEYWEERLGEIRLSEITPALVIKERDLILRGRIPSGRGKGTTRDNSTANKYVTTLSSILRACILDYQWLDLDPCKQIRGLKIPKGRERDPLTLEEMEALMEACKNHSLELYTAVALSLSTGARQTEIWSLKKENIDYKNGFITFFETKNGDKRTVAIIDSVLNHLKELKLKHGAEGYIFPQKQRKEGNPSSYFNFRKPFLKALREAGIEGFVWHDLRHCCASFFVMKGIPDQMIMKIMGWRNRAMLERYAHMRPENIHQAQQEMAEQFLPNF